MAISVNYSLLMRCTSRKYATELMDEGSILFGTAQKWVDYARRNSEGRGDKLEGTYAACLPDDIPTLVSFRQRYPDAYCEHINGLLYFRRKSIMQLPCYCFYMLRHDLFTPEPKEGIQELDAVISGSYFQDFADEMSPDDISRLPLDEQPSLVLIKKHDEFVERIFNAVAALGVHRDDIIYIPVEYTNKRAPFLCNPTGRPFPDELTTKDLRFKDHAEGRIIVNTTDANVCNQLCKIPIRIGPLHNIAYQIDDYFHAGIGIKARGLVESI